MLDAVLLEIIELHSKDWAELAFKLDDETLVDLKEKILDLEEKLATSSPRNQNDVDELKAARDSYFQYLFNSALPNKILFILSTLANVDKVTKESIHHYKLTKNKEATPITPADLADGWFNQIPHEIDLPNVSSKLTILSNILREHSLHSPLDDHINRLVDLNNHIKSAYKKKMVAKVQDKRAEIIKSRDTELKKLPPEKELILRNRRCKELRTIMAKHLQQNEEMLTGFPDSYKKLLQQYNNEIKITDELLERYKLRSESDIPIQKSVLESYDLMITNQNIALRAIRIINKKAEEALKQLENPALAEITIAEITAAREKKVKQALAELNSRIVDQAKEQHAKELAASTTSEDLPARGSRTSTDGSRSPKSLNLFRNLSNGTIGRFLGNTPPPPTRTRTSTPTLESLRRIPSNSQIPISPSRSNNNSPSPKFSLGGVSPKSNSQVSPKLKASGSTISSREDGQGETIMIKRREADLDLNNRKP